MATTTKPAHKRPKRFNNGGICSISFWNSFSVNQNEKFI